MLDSGDMSFSNRREGLIVQCGTTEMLMVFRPVLMLHACMHGTAVLVWQMAICKFYSASVADTSRNFEHVCLRCPFEICESFKYNAWYMSNSLLDYCNVTRTLYTYILVCLTMS